MALVIKARGVRVIRSLLLALLMVSALPAVDIQPARTALSYNLRTQRPWMPLFWGGFTTLPNLGDSPQLRVTLPVNATTDDRLTVRAGGGLSFNSDGTQIILGGSEYISWDGPAQGASSRTTLVINLSGSNPIESARQILQRIYFSSVADPVSGTGSRSIGLSIGSRQSAPIVVSLVDGNVPPMALFGTIAASKGTPASIRLIEGWDDSLGDNDLKFFITGSAAGSFGTLSGGNFVALAEGALVPAPSLIGVYFLVNTTYAGGASYSAVNMLVGEATTPIPTTAPWPMPITIVDGLTVLQLSGPPLLNVDMTVTGPPPGAFAGDSPYVDLSTNGTGLIPVIEAHPLTSIRPTDAAIVVTETVGVENQRFYRITIDRAQVQADLPAKPAMCGWVLAFKRTIDDPDPVRIPMLVMLRWTPRNPG